MVMADPDIVYDERGLIEGLDSEIGVLGGASYNADGYGYSLGRGPELGVTWVDAEVLSASTAYNIDSFLGGATLFINSEGVLQGIVVGGPSLGASFSKTTPDGSITGGKTLIEKRN